MPDILTTSVPASKKITNQRHRSCSSSTRIAASTSLYSFHLQKRMPAYFAREAPLLKTCSDMTRSMYRKNRVLRIGMGSFKVPMNSERAQVPALVASADRARVKSDGVVSMRTSTAPLKTYPLSRAWRRSAQRLLRAYVTSERQRCLAAFRLKLVMDVTFLQPTAFPLHLAVSSPTRRRLKGRLCASWADDPWSPAFVH